MSQAERRSGIGLMLEEHLGYVADSVRVELYKAAIAQAVAPGDSVADLGCGSGILGLLCLQAGADHVYAVDGSAMIDIARESFRRAGHGDRATFIQGRSDQIELPELVDVVICDHVGYFGFDYGVTSVLADARRRFLKTNGTLIPSRVRLQIAVVGSDECSEIVNSWQSENIPAEFHWLKSSAINTKHAINLKRKDVCSTAVILGDIDVYADNPEYFSWNAELQIEHEGIVNGLAGWFDCELSKDVWMTNSPLAGKPINRPQAFLPIGEAVQVKSGDPIKASIMARPSNNLIAWVVDFPASGQRFRHSTWQGMHLSPEHLLWTNPKHVPHLSHEGQARTIVLGYCDGKKSAQEIGEAVLRDHPNLFPSPTAISDFVLRELGRNTE